MTPETIYGKDLADLLTRHSSLRGDTEALINALIAEVRAQRQVIEELQTGISQLEAERVALRRRLALAKSKTDLEPL